MRNCEKNFIYSKQIIPKEKIDVFILAAFLRFADDC